jgi:hypothetical protein
MLIHSIAIIPEIASQFARNDENLRVLFGFLDCQSESKMLTLAKQTAEPYGQLNHSLS